MNPIAIVKTAGRALKSRNYRLFFFGQLVSLIGNWMTQMATSWLVYRITHDPEKLGLVTFCGQMPAFFMAPFAGVFIDRWDLRKTLIVTQICSMMQSFALAYLAWGGHATVGHLLVLYVIQGVINGIDIPARQAIVSDLVDDPADLGNAIALNSSLFNLARLIGPSIAGFVIAAWGERICFAIDGVSYLAAIVAVFLIRVGAKPQAARQGNILRDLREGVTYAATFPPLREIMVLCAVVSLLGIPTQMLMPVFATDFLGGGPRTQGALMAGIGVGAVVGALMLASRRTVVGLGRWMAWTGVMFGVILVAFAWSRVAWVSVLLMGGLGWTLVILNASANTLVQTIADEDKRGRTLSLLLMCYLGFVPVGGLMYGALSQPQRLGAATAVTIGGICCGLAAGVFMLRLPELRKHVRPILVRRGILPPIAKGLEAHAELTAPPEQAG